MNNSEILKLENISKIYKTSENYFEVLIDSSFTLYNGELVSLVGSSGCGKTTLLQLCGLLDTPTDGYISINGNFVHNLTDVQKTIIRQKHIGFIFQFHYLLSDFSIIENIILPALISNELKKKQILEKAEDILINVGLKDKMNCFPYQLSGGEKQRVAIARAIINNPSIILADEPTGNLDPQNAEIVFNLLIDTVKKYKSALLMATHNIDLAKKLKKTITIKNKKITTINL